ncbi:hypothetical protein [Micromonospora sp. KC207]|uniref:hypothetical protein n=1 Tax=Micromonospora sp. KC207 TaxID=2530377 RepID=UPI0014043A96|nr:hypothetical protein [Micromonospora sp. KC207]
MTSIDCEICGQAGAREVPAPSGGTMEACRRCERAEHRRAAIDERAYAEMALAA